MTATDWIALVVPVVTLLGVVYGAGKISAAVDDLDYRLGRIERWIDTGAWKRPRRADREGGWSD